MIFLSFKNCLNQLIIVYVSLRVQNMHAHLCNVSQFLFNQIVSCTPWATIFDRPWITLEPQIYTGWIRELAAAKQDSINGQSRVPTNVESQGKPVKKVCEFFYFSKKAGN